MELPTFRYHPDPIATNAIVCEEIICCACHKKRGYKYTGSLYSENDHGEICPWCISDGSAAEKFNGIFTDDEPLLRNGIREEIVKEVTQRTPGFQAWQQEIWLSHCGDAAAYLGDSIEMARLAPEDFWTSVRSNIGLNDDDFSEYKNGIFKGDLAVYIFKCLSCNKLIGYSDHT